MRSGSSTGLGFGISLLEPQFGIAVNVTHPTLGLRRSEKLSETYNMSESTEKRIALVTGAGRGDGKSIFSCRIQRSPCYCISRLEVPGVRL